MDTEEIRVKRLSVVSSNSFDETLRKLTAPLGHPEMATFHRALVAARSAADIEETVKRAVGASQLMEFARFDSGGVLRNVSGDQNPQILRLLVGNPLVMQDMARHVPDAASYAPVTILVDERADGVHLSYDSMASLLGPYGSLDALAIAEDLDRKVKVLLETAAR
jgi:hypothetical protein